MILLKLMVPTLEDSLSLLKRINRIKIDNRPICDFYSYKGYSLWSFYQQILWEEMRRFQAADTMTNKQKKNYAFAPVKDLVQKFFILAISLISLVVLLVKKPRVIVFSNDIVQGTFKTDLRINELYRFLSRKNISYAEIIHTVFNRGLVSRFFARRRPTFYLETADAIFSVTKYFKETFFPAINSDQIDWSDFSEKERAFVEGILRLFSRRAEISMLKIKLFKRFFKIIKPELLFSIDDVRHYHELVLAAKLAGVKTCGFQHGRFNKYLVGWINYEITPEKCLVPDKYFVWNEYWRNKIIGLSPTFRHYKERIKIGGKPGLQDSQNNFISRIPDDITIILIPFEIKSRTEEVNFFIKKILSCPNMKVNYRLRRDQPEREQLERVKVFLSNKSFKTIYEVSEENLKSAGVVAATYSTMLYEMVEKGVPVAVLESSTTQADDLVNEGMATKIKLNSEICTTLKKISETKEDVLRQWADKFRTPVKLEDTLAGIL